MEPYEYEYREHLRACYPDLPDDEIEEVVDRLDRYLRVMMQIAQRERDQNSGGG